MCVLRKQCSVMRVEEEKHHILTVSSPAVYALDIPPWADRYLEYSFSSGYFSVP